MKAPQMSNNLFIYLRVTLSQSGYSKRSVMLPREYERTAVAHGEQGGHYLDRRSRI